MNFTIVMNHRIFWITVFWIIISIQGFSQVWTYDCPGGEEYKSPDYEVSIIQGSDTLESFVYYSYRKSVYVRYNPWNLQPADTSYQDLNEGLRSHSTSIFSFSDTVTVRVKINSGAGISLPLNSAKVLPSSFNIPCVVKDGNIIEFKLDKPWKVAVIANYDEIWDIYEQKGIGHIPISSWKNSWSAEIERETFNGTGLVNSLSEGYTNPLFVFAHAPEKRVPDTNSPKTLVLNPGDNIRSYQLYKYDTVWFKPGVHDLSKNGNSPWYRTEVNKGQTFYLEGGAYVKARFKGTDSGPGSSSIVGRGIISGDGYLWMRSFAEGSQVITVDSLIGVTITDRACFGIYGGKYIGDIAMIGAWHGNTDGPDYIDNCLIEDCFLLAGDDNLKINHNTHARRCVIWQGSNAHAIMVKEALRNGELVFANSIVEDIDVICYFQDPTSRIEDWARHGMGAIACVTAVPFTIRNFTFRDIRIESPYLYRIFNIYNLNTNEVNPGWFMPSTEKWHSKIDGMHFENISVNSPLIFYRSILGSGYDNSVKNFTFKNINVNGILINEKNKDQFFDIKEERIDGLKFRK